MKLLIYGTGKFAEYVEYLITDDTDYEVVGFCIEKSLLREDKLNNLPVLSFDDIEETYPPDEYKMFVAVGINLERKRIFDLVKGKGYQMINYLSSHSKFFKDFTYGENNWIDPGTGIQPFSSIGDNNFLIGARIAHHATIGNHTLLSGCSLGGNVTIGDYTFVGINASIQQNVTIAKGNVIGMGCNIEKDTKDNEIYHTGKATKLRTLTTDRFEKKYLK